MPFEAVTNLASVQAADDERKRRREAALQQTDELRLKLDRDERAAEDLSGPAGVLDSLQRSGRTAVDSDVLQAAGEDRFLNSQAERRFDRRALDLQKRSERLAVPGPTAAERATTMLAPLGRFGTEDAAAANQELRTDPRGRLAALEERKAAILANVQGAGDNVSRETFTDAPRRGGATQGVEYTGALDALQGAEVPRSAIRPEFGGTAPDTTLAFSDRPEAGMRRYGAPGKREDVGAPGGGLMTASRGDADQTPQAALLAGLDEQINEAKRQPFSPQERAADLAVQQPGWDIAASRTTPEDITQNINEAVGEGRLNPATGQYLIARYQMVANEAYDSNGEFSPDVWAQRLTSSRPPAPGEAEQRAKTGGQVVPAAKAAEQQAVTAALEAPQGGPGAMRSPALASAGGTDPEALLAEIRQPRGQSYTVPQVGGELGYEMNAPFIPPGMGEGPATPPWLADLPEDLRLVLEGASRSAGGRESAAERRRRLAREAARRG